MLRLDDDTLVLAASDVTDFVACGHLTAQRLAIVRGERGRPQALDDPHLELIRARGDAHEREQLERLSAVCGGHVDLARERDPHSRAELEQSVAETVEAMRAGVPLIYQATFFDGRRWQGRTDFLRRVDHPSDLGDYAYELLDTKLARHVKPAVVHQLSLYSRLLALVQGVELPTATVILGTGEEVRIELRRYAALHRRVVARLERMVEAETPSSEPEPVAHCQICSLEAECDRRLRDLDHLSLVANARRDQRDKLVMVGITTVARLASAPADARVPRLSDERLELLRGQAALQVHARETGELAHRHLKPERARGYARLPRPDPGDLFFDLEGDPYVGDGGIEYLWGWCDAEGRYEHVWAHDRAAERAALQRFIDLVVARRREHPHMRVYHYAPHETSTLKRLALTYGTREEELDVLLREQVFVDLYAVVRQGLQVGEESYSLKRLERHHDFQRLERTVREGGGSIIAYERWLSERDDELLEAIRAYNEEDCRSTLSLRDWLHHTMLPEAARRFGVDFAALAEPAPEPGSAEEPAWLRHVSPWVERLTASVPDDSGDDDADQAERRLLADLLLYHGREHKPQWWQYFALSKMTPVELEDERDAIGSLRRDESIRPEAVRRSLRYAYAFPPQEHRLKPGRLIDPATGREVTVDEITDTHVFITCGKSSPPPEPKALIAPSPPPTRALRDSLGAIAESVLAGDDGRFAAVRSILRRELPRLDAALFGEDVETLCAATLALTDTHLAIQGPPGTGKTYRAARMIVAALRAGRRVAITAPSHAAIHNLLDAVERHAHEVGVALDGVYKGEGYNSPHGLVEEVAGHDFVTDDHRLVAGTAWTLAREQHREAFDLLFADEAGQLALADTVAAGACARAVVLLGDPQQLPQVTQAEHPGGAGRSALEHLLDGADTIPLGQGVLLTESWRMHPDVCRFVSERSYEGRLRSRADCARRRVDARGALSGAGLRLLPVEHVGCSQASVEEAEAIAAACNDLLDGGRVVDDKGESRALEPRDIMVVAPYNLAVRCITEHVPDGVRVGTVDRFQGQEAPVVFFAMTCSTGHDVPRGLDFLFSRNRLNVAISRAQCLAVLVHNPALLDANCPTLAAMELVDGACRFGEMAAEVAAAVGGAPS